MKVRVKATGEIKEVARGIYSPYQYVDKEGTIYTEGDVEELPGDDGAIFFDATIDYWTRLEHTYAGMAMQGILSNEAMQQELMRVFGKEECIEDVIVDYAKDMALLLVKKMKEERR